MNTNTNTTTDFEMDGIDTTAQLPIFCYGTLRPGHGNSTLWQGMATARYDGRARVLGRRLVTNGGFPYMLRSGPTDQAVGTLIFPKADLYDHVLARMDALEGVPVHYIRDTVAVLCWADGDEAKEDAAIFAAWTYTPCDERHYEGLRQVTDNDWNAHVPPRWPRS